MSFLNSPWHLRIQLLAGAIAAIGWEMVGNAAGGLDPHLPPIEAFAFTYLSWPLALFGSTACVVLFFIDVGRELERRRATAEAGGTVPSPPAWLKIKDAVHYIRNRSGWRTNANGPAWSDALDADMRIHFASFFGPRVRGRRYPAGLNPVKFDPPKQKRIPRHFWKNARFDSDAIRTTPARLTATDGVVFYDDIEVERSGLMRAFPERKLPAVRTPERDTPLADGLFYIISRRWDRTFDGDGKALFVELSRAIREFRQKAYDGDLHVWARRNPNHGVWIEVERKAWEDGSVEIDEILHAVYPQGEASPEPEEISGDVEIYAGGRLIMGPEPERFYDFMVCRWEFEMAWPP